MDGKKRKDVSGKLFQFFSEGANQFPISFDSF